MKFTVDPKYKEERVDTFLVTMLKDNYPITRSALAKVMDAITLNGKSVKKGNLLKEGDVLELDELIFESKLTDEDHQIISVDKPLEIIEETDGYLIIKKPKGVAVHPSKGNVDNTIANYVKYYLEKKGEYDIRVKRGGIVHRLDKQVSGLLLVAKTLEYQQYLQKQFEDRLVNKIYLAKVKTLSKVFPINENEPKEEIEKIIKDKFVVDNRWIKIEEYIYRDPSNRLKMRINEKNAGRLSITYVIPLKDNQLLVKIETGRMHQIRATMNYLGWVVENDRLYGDSNSTTNGITLEQIVLEFRDREGKKKLARLV